MVIDGRKIAGDIVAGLKRKRHLERLLAAVLVGENPASVSFLHQKERTARELGIEFRLFRFPGDVSQDELRHEIEKIASQDACGGLTVQLPLPPRIRREHVLDAIPKEQDVDVLGSAARQAFAAGTNRVLPPAVGAVAAVLEYRGYNVETARCAVLGANGFLVGGPVATWLHGQCAELIALDLGDDLSALSNADVVILGTGNPGLVTPEILKDGAFVIDFGYGTSDGEVRGDLDMSELKAKNQKHIVYTPTPGGTGPILVAKLLENFYTLNS